jgi:adenylosuccinate synthase
MLKVDVIVGVQHGDEGKGKVTHHLLKSGEYTHCVRYNGGCNAGHTIYHEGKKFVTHHIPAGVFFGVKSIIGPGCVVDINKFLFEIKVLEDAGLPVRETVFIAKNAHIIQERHLWGDSGETRLGTTRTGNGPCYSDKYSRSGIRAQDVNKLKPYLIDMYEEFHINNNDAVVLCEGAQGFGLDIDWGNYPYVTSSHCTTAGAMLNGFPPKSIRNVYGVAKIYETYVGSKSFQPKDDIFCRIQKAGSEFGATTGRKRQCNWMNLTSIRRAIDINGVNCLIINKIDVLEEVGQWAVEVGGTGNGSLLVFGSGEELEDYISEYLHGIKVIFSGDPERI